MYEALLPPWAGALLLHISVFQGLASTHQLMLMLVFRAIPPLTCLCLFLPFHIPKRTLYATDPRDCTTHSFIHSFILSCFLQSRSRERNIKDQNDGWTCTVFLFFFWQISHDDKQCPRLISEETPHEVHNININVSFSIFEGFMAHGNLSPLIKRPKGKSCWTRDHGRGEMSLV